MIYRLSLIAATVMLMCAAGCARFSYVEHRRGYKRLKQPYVRVKVVEAKKVTLKSTGPYELLCFKQDGERTEYHSNSDITVTLSKKLLTVKDKSGLPLEELVSRVVASPVKERDHLVLNGRAFRGVADVIVENDSISVVNAVYMEDYLKGVLPPEIGHHGRPEWEALKAQAVASRTYAVSRYSIDPTKAYDLVGHVADQVYDGMSTEDTWTNGAVSETKGEVLLSDGETITAYYHSTCGGATENVEHVWERDPASYLRARLDDPYCHWSKFYAWTYTWTRQQLESSISDYLEKSGRLQSKPFTLRDLEIIDKLPSGRVRILKVTTSAGEYLILKDQIRWALIRPDKPGAILPSTNLELRIIRSSSGEITQIEATGKGNGHGVGMCQCGALGRSRSGQEYRSILSSYYTGAEIIRVY